MERNINLLPFNEVSIVREWNIHTLRHRASIIIERDGVNWVIVEDVEKVYDVSYMPSYIKEDWINYNKQELTVEIVDLHIKDYERIKESQWPSPESWDMTISNLKSIKRNLIIGKII
jgi:hypothetical protein